MYRDPQIQKRMLLGLVAKNLDAVLQQRQTIRSHLLQIIGLRALAKDLGEKG